MNMTEQNTIEETATLCPTKAGNGYKVVVKNVWYYASKQQLLDLVQGRQKVVTFHTITDDFQVAA